MDMRAHWLRGSALLFLTVFLLACSPGNTKVESDLGFEGAPDWVNEGTNMLSTKEGRVLHGVGSAPPLGDFSLQKSAADNRARAEVARILSSYMEIVSRDYISSGKAADQGFTEQSISREIDNVTRINLTGARIIGSWKDPETGTIFSIAELKLDQVKDLLEGVEAMNAGLRDYMNNEGDAIFDRVATDTEK